MTSVIKQEATGTRYGLEAYPNGKFGVLIFDDPKNPDIAKITLDKTEAEVRQLLGADADEQMRVARRRLQERRSRKP